MMATQTHKGKFAGPVVITANRVRDGQVVYRDANDDWSTDLQRAAVATTAAEADEILFAANADGLRVTGAYAARVRVDAQNHIEPNELREAIRRDGPTIQYTTESTPT